MYSNKKNIIQLVGLMKAHDISNIVVSPGSRNLPVVMSLAGDKFFTCHTVVDERSAGFFAIGIAQHTRKAVAICCTSGSAVLNYAPSVAEAFYQRVPLVVITADRPQSWIGQMTGQTIPQPDVFGKLTKCAVNLPEVRTSDDEWYCNRLVNEALLEVYHHGSGPVHINIPLSEPLYEYTDTPLPLSRVIRREPVRPNIPPGYALRFSRYKRRMIIVGQSMNMSAAAQLYRLIRNHDCVILSEHLANIPHERHICNFDAVLGGTKPKNLIGFAPDLLITTGGHIVSKRIRQFLSENPPKEHWHVTPSGEVVDTYRCVTEVIEAEGSDFIRFLAELSPQYSIRPYSRLWAQRSELLPEPSAEYSDLMAIGALVRNIPKYSNLQLANSSAVRLAQLFRLGRRISVFSNRGTSGIDGCLSTAMGQASVCKEPTFIIIGDLAFFYDMNTLWNRVAPNLRIMLSNNGGGGIFHTLDGIEMREEVDSHTIVRHTSDAKAWSESRGLVYLPVTDERELSEQMPMFTDESAGKPMLMEVFTSMERNAEILRRYYDSLVEIGEDEICFDD
ncbi:MAG: 2-succinyl-5-enolpyruvyl-6-hydroxy-3-cyclohexene-1-carboxylic-acid synthase [Tannerellaceae bacterium]|jgi:2-succinyl-5-enolpyruvyl-6-hydroxy-3-cyclohexene-1-carboxylate synthase|nr:2-succinyl-5-enolpyruvyl-6-hydroxy-3-cyclohexene-1-carboxylic-acid synthase [Tannerellaceae bacterium]